MCLLQRPLHYTAAQLYCRAWSTQPSAIHDPFDSEMGSFGSGPLINSLFMTQIN